MWKILLFASVLEFQFFKENLRSSFAFSRSRSRMNRYSRYGCSQGGKKKFLLIKPGDLEYQFCRSLVQFKVVSRGNLHDNSKDDRYLSDHSRIHWSMWATHQLRKVHCSVGLIEESFQYAVHTTHLEISRNFSRPFKESSVKERGLTFPGLLTLDSSSNRVLITAVLVLLVSTKCVLRPSVRYGPLPFSYFECKPVQPSSPRRDVSRGSQVQPRRPYFPPSIFTALRRAN